MQNTDTSRPSRVKVTRIQDGCFHTCIRHPADGVAETSSAEVAPRPKTTRPPETLYAFTSSFPAPRRGWGGAGGAGLAEEGEAGGEDGDEGETEGEGDRSGGGAARCVEEERGCVASGTASGGS